MPDFFKYHGLGNDYLVLEPRRFTAAPTAEAVQRICDRNRGIGGDGILWGPLAGEGARSPFAVRIFNPDGSEAEKSGNGLRIFARFLWDQRYATQSPFQIQTPGGTVTVRILDDAASRIAIEMGQATFDSARIPVNGPKRDVLREALAIGGRQLTINAASVGNPHCVVLVDAPTPELAREIGPLIERHTLFPNRTNVQFMRRIDEHAIQIEIWERGAGYTLASGTSSCAAAAVACRLGLCRSPVTVHMPGGTLEVRLDADYRIEMEGPVSGIGHGDFLPDLLRETGLVRKG
ncbi:MAG TPA: diaminopimelate epimerase [bacterium]